jgi:CubicO group peptidase (beta-lactamase class C family)
VPLIRPALVAATLLVAACGRRPDFVEDRDAYPHARDSIGSVREIYDGTLTPELAVQTFRNIDRLFPTRAIVPAATPRALPPSGRMLTTLRVPLGDSAVSVEQYLEHNRVAAVLVLHEGRIAYERYRYGNGPRTRWMSMSVAKSVTSTLIGAAMRDGAITSLDDAVTRYVPSLAGSAYDGVTVRQVLTMTSGVRWSERYTDPTSDRRRLLEAQIAQQPGGALAVMRALPRAAAPGSVNT